MSKILYIRHLSEMMGRDIYGEEEIFDFEINDNTLKNLPKDVLSKLLESQLQHEQYEEAERIRRVQNPHNSFT